MKASNIVLGLVFILIATTEASISCPVCFGATESSKSTESINMAVIVLLGITGTILSLFGAFFMYIRKRMKITLNGTFDYPSLN